MRKISYLVLLLFAFSFTCSAYDEPDVSAYSAALMVADTGELIYGKNEHEKRSMASTTKIMTALLTLECATPQKWVTVTEQMTAVEGTSMGLLPGDKVTYHDLVYGMLLASGNDAANAAAISVAGSLPDFAVLMNSRAEQIGMLNTSFVTPSGLDDDNHYSTAFDMALLGCAAIQNPDFFAACSSSQAKLCYGNEPYDRYLSNHNRLLKSFDGAVGIKTGFTKKSGRCLVSAAQRNGVTLVCVTLNAPDDWQDHTRLLEYGFERVLLKTLDCQLPQLTVYGGAVQRVSVELCDPLSIASAYDEAFVSTQLIIRPYAVAPLKKGDIVGEVRVIINGKSVKSVPVTVGEDVAAITEETFDTPSFFNRIAEKLSDFFCMKER